MAWRPSCPHVHTSNSSSSVPTPPGSATKASANAAMRALRSCIVSTTCSAVSPGWAISRATRLWGITPITSPPAASAASATAPISPTLAPPYTTPTPRAASARPRACAASRYAGRAPSREPQNTPNRRMVIP